MKRTFTLLCLLSYCVSGLADCRSAKTVRLFNLLHGSYHNPPGMIVDHICPLSVGGLDIIGNMQHQTKAEAKEKDRWELLPTKRSFLCNATNSQPNRTVFNCKD